ncbi:MAG: ATP-binding protein [Nitrospirales bacterium]
MTDDMVSPSGVRVLLMEDNPSDAELTKIRLRRANPTLSYEFFHTELLSDALAFLHTSSVDVILLDLSLPDADGEESVNALQDAFSHIPIIIVSGSRENAWSQKIVQLGIQGYIEKNRVDGELLGNAIRYAIERKKSERVLLASKAENEQLLASISYVLIEVGEHDRIIRWNTTAERIFALTASEMLGKPFCESDIPWDWERIYQGSLLCREHGKPIHLHNVWFHRKNESSGSFDVTLNPIHEQAKEIGGFLLLANDVSELRNLEVQLSLARKMESIGQLSAGIAHEINTPVQFVRDNLQFMRDSFVDLQKVLDIYARMVQTMPRDAFDPQLLQAMDTALAVSDLAYITEEIPKAMQQSLDGIDRVGNIVGAMKVFSHPGTAEKKLIDLNHAIESTVMIARNEWKYVADMVLHLDPTLPPIPCFPGELNQVLLNLLVNAAHAIEAVVGKAGEAKGTITVSTHMQEDWVEIRIADTGTGIPEEAGHKIFDPFFTTKDVGKGTGQGLAIAHDVIVKKHGGRLTFETAIGQGTTFIIQVPYPLESQVEGHDEPTQLVCGQRT